MPIVMYTQWVKIVVSNSLIVGLILNVTKTKVMVFLKRRNPVVTVKEKAM